MLAESSLAIDVVYAGGSPTAVLALDPRPDIVLLDLDLEGGPVDPADVQAMVAAGSTVLVVSAMASPWVVRKVLDAGASGLVAKADTPTHLETAIVTVMSGEPWHSTDLARVLQVTAGPEVKLSSREAEVLNLYASGLTISAVATKMGITPDTVKTHLKRMRVKFADAGRPAPTAADLYREGMRARIITDEDN